MGTDERAPSDRLADHAAIDALADELIPALIAKLGASGLGEIEVREGDWKVRLRRPADGLASAGGRKAGRAATTTPPARPALMPVGPGRAPGEAPLDEAELRATGGTTDPDPELLIPVETPARGRDPFRSMATSPAVGFFQPRPGIVAGARVRAGDAIGSIDVLGVAIEVVAPADGIVGASLVEPGEAVEYGQELVWVELLSSTPAGGDGGPAAAMGDT